MIGRKIPDIYYAWEERGVSPYSDAEVRGEAGEEVE